jgi:hypothetical protein
MRIVLFAASDTDADEWIEWFVGMSPNVRTAAVDAAHTLITTITPSDDLAERLDPDNAERWSRSLPIKVMRTDRSRHATDPTVIDALARLARRYPVADPTGLLPAPEHDARFGYASDDRSAPLGTAMQRNHSRSRKPVGVHRGT